MLWSGSIFITANEKLVCFSLQGQGTRALWRVVKIDWEHKLSAPLNDLEAPMCRWACAFELSFSFLCLMLQDGSCDLLWGGFLAAPGSNSGDITNYIAGIKSFEMHKTDINKVYHNVDSQLYDEKKIRILWKWLLLWWCSNHWPQCCKNVFGQQFYWKIQIPYARPASVFKCNSAVPPCMFGFENGFCVALRIKWSQPLDVIDAMASHQPLPFYGTLHDVWRGYITVLVTIVQLAVTPSWKERQVQLYIYDWHVFCSNTAHLALLKQNKCFIFDNNPITTQTEQLSHLQVQLILVLLGLKVQKAQCKVRCFIQ